MKERNPRLLKGKMSLQTEIRRWAVCPGSELTSIKELEITKKELKIEGKKPLKISIYRESTKLVSMLRIADGYLCNPLGKPSFIDEEIELR